MNLEKKLDFIITLLIHPITKLYTFYSLTFNKAGGVDYVYVFTNVTGVIKTNETSDKITIKIRVK